MSGHFDSMDLFTPAELEDIVASAKEAQREFEDFAEWLRTPEAQAEFAGICQELIAEAEKFQRECAAGKYALSPAELEQLRRDGVFVSHQKKGRAAMIDRWADLEQLRDDGRRVLYWIKQQGVVMCCDPTEHERAKEFILPVFRTLADIVCAIPLRAVYLYRQSDQPPTLRTSNGILMQDVDGIEWVDVTPDRGRLHAVGISTEALDKGAEYVQMVFIHELAHIFCGGEYGPEFHACLDGFIARFNAATGGRVKNDYAGLP